MLREQAGRRSWNSVSQPFPGISVTGEPPTVHTSTQHFRVGLESFHFWRALRWCWWFWKHTWGSKMLANVPWTRREVFLLTGTQKYTQACAQPLPPSTSCQPQVLGAHDSASLTGSPSSWGEIAAPLHCLTQNSGSGLLWPRTQVPDFSALLVEMLVEINGAYCGARPVEWCQHCWSSSPVCLIQGCVLKLNNCWMSPFQMFHIKNIPFQSQEASKLHPFIPLKLPISLSLSLSLQATALGQCAILSSQVTVPSY